jgi:N-acetylneuraminic acid mutarotase
LFVKKVLEKAMIRKTSSTLFLSNISSVVFCLALFAIAIGCGSGTSSTGNSGGGGTPPPNPSANQWTWVGGSNLRVGASSSVYGTEGVAAAGNTPGGRSGAVSWTDSSGNFWLFGGGTAADSLGNPANLNDLWEFNPTTKEWVWVSGSSSENASGIYGTLGTPSTSNVPGARNNAVGWIDSKGNLWLFGGQGIDSAGTTGWLNDLWEFNPTTKEWVWVSGSNTVPIVDGGQPGDYGTEGIADAANVPGGRWGAVSWMDADGNLWLFGGDGVDSGKLQGDLNDLWKFNPSTKEWTWVSGSKGSYTTGVYGTLGTPATTNAPPGRVGAVCWLDRAGNLWLFGGQGYDSIGQSGNFNDLWEFNPTAATWTWVSGSSTVGANAGQPGVYGTMGTANAANSPGGHSFATGWVDSSGQFWFFGGYSYSSVPAQYVVQYHYANELWEFNLTTKEWTWMGGSQTAGANGGQPGMYGSLGSPAVTNIPGSRTGASSWIDTNGNLWLFGGDGYDSSGKQGVLNDLWRYTP